MKKCVAITMVSMLAVAAAWADEEEDLALKLANPVANLISVPIQANYDENIGPNDDGSVWRVNIQPVIPFELNDDWNIITRTIVPLIDQSDIPVKGQGESGLGDISASQFFSPKDGLAVADGNESERTERSRDEEKSVVGDRVYRGGCCGRWCNARRGGGRRLAC